MPVLYTDHEDGRGAQLYQAACSLDLEGIVAKWKYGILGNDAGDGMLTFLGGDLKSYCTQAFDFN